MTSDLAQEIKLVKREEITREEVRDEENRQIRDVA